MHTSISQVAVTARTDVASYNLKITYNGRFADCYGLVALLNELDGLVRPWTQGAFEIGVTI